MYSITTIGLVGFTGIRLTGINASGELVGIYSDSAGLHVFVDDNGAVTTTTVQGVASVSGTRILASGEVVGNANAPGGPPVQEGFAISNGTISLIQKGNSTTITGANNAGAIVGSFSQLGLTGVPRNHGFIDINGIITTVDVPGSTNTSIAGINDSGEIVGTYSNISSPSHGFVDINGTFTTIDPAESTRTSIVGVNNSGVIVGTYLDSSRLSHGFVDINGTITTIDPAGSISTNIVGVNNSGVIVGTYLDSSRVSHGFVDINGTVTTIDPAGIISTNIVGVNNSGAIVGTYSDGITIHGFVDFNGAFTTIDPAGAISISIVGINDSGEIFGSYIDSTGAHSFTATEGAPVLTITGTQANQATTDAISINPFGNVLIGAPSVGTTTETLQVTLSNATNGTLFDPNAATDGGTFSNGVYAVTGSADTVTTALEGLVFIPTANQVAPGQSVSTGFTIGVTNTLGQTNLTTSDNTASVIATSVNDAPTLLNPALSFTVAEGQTVQNLYASLLANAKDVDFGDQSQLTVSTLGLSNTMGFLYFDPVNQMLTYTADGFNPAKPVDSFTYTISDPQGATVTGTVDLTVTGAALPTKVGTAGADRLSVDGSGHRLIGGDGNDTLTADGSNQLIFGGRGDDTIAVDGSRSVIYAGPGTNKITLDGSGQTVVLQQGGLDQISGFNLHNGDIVDLSQALAEAQINLAGDFSQLGSFVQVTSAGRDVTLSFGGSSLAVLHGVGTGVTLDTLVQDGSLRIN